MADGRATPSWRLTMVVCASGGVLGVGVLGWGGFRAFFSPPALTALALVTFVISVAAYFAGGNLSTGVREDRTNRWVIAAFAVIGLLFAYLPAWTDRHELWTIDGDAVRWLGVILFAVGGGLRIWPVYVLGNRFSGLVAVQPGHTLLTAGIYGAIRHPSYPGLPVNAFGWDLAFRSWAGVLLAALLVPLLLARIRSEEAFLRAQFGAAYDAYCARTAPLRPAVF